ncbi:MAG: hypothetical protein COU85_00845 [Candidatus Portnoybacteria bacterium CG10_big_fil_rev_8_21_14_0_10_44_7]|uniref:Uncharacterized protein n=1 Tax=Candidatus Portnoybacteria bacterium CG10_big_fil_rev_8_21_14_0_10_44_7 TaxID=1974816 RepID=A0A2M8KJ81_9BACT|nr:MAG: hypothetical protein COU85_00845 [Candidatus Portnoybacteria bacterium CG10_big_fil_rev_8_21_14_0_10_44_7]
MTVGDFLQARQDLVTLREAEPRLVLPGMFRRVEQIERLIRQNLGINQTEPLALYQEMELGGEVAEFVLNFCSEVGRMALVYSQACVS